MCLICIDYQKGLLTLNEALNNLEETIVDSQPTEHYFEVFELLFPDEES